MDGRAASLTVTDKIPYLIAHGIELTVISAITGKKETRFKHIRLLPLGPSGLRFDLRHWFANNYGRGPLYKIVLTLISIVLLPFIILERILINLSSQSSWAIPAFVYGFVLYKQKKIDLIYSSGGAWSAHLAGWLLKKATKLPWIAEVHDPMIIRSSELDDGSTPRKTRDKRFLQKLEGLISRDCDHAWWFTEGALEYARKRHSILGNKGFVVMPGAEPPLVQNSHIYTDKLHIAHFGSLAIDRSLAPIIRALHDLMSSNHDLLDKIVIDVYGAPLDDASKKIIKDCNMQDYVNVHGRLESDPKTGESGRCRVQKEMHRADVLLLLHGDYEWCAEYIPSKWYDYLWSGRPIFAVTNRNPHFDQLLKERNSYISKTLEHTTIVDSLSEICDDWVAKRLRAPIGGPIGVEQSVNRIMKEIYK